MIRCRADRYSLAASLARVRIITDPKCSCTRSYQNTDLKKESNFTTSETQVTTTPEYDRFTRRTKCTCVQLCLVVSQRL